MAAPDTTEYRKITGDYVSTIEVDGKKILKVAPEGLTFGWLCLAKCLVFWQKPA